MEWKKLLYLRQPYPDNYTDTSFLDQLKRNTTVAKYSYAKLFADFSLIAYYALLLLLVNVNFTAIYSGQWSAFQPTIILSLVAGAFFLAFSAEQAQLPKLYVVLVVLLLVISPVLRSLTESTSLDSIWALSVILTLAAVLCHDYSLDVSALYRSIISSNLSFANGIVLASRLKSSTSVFAFLVFSIETCILVPLFDFRLRRHHVRLHYLTMALVVALLCWLLTAVYGVAFACLYVASVAFVLVALPLYFLFLQRYKNELQGPWDTAKPVLSTKL